MRFRISYGIRKSATSVGILQIKNIEARDLFYRSFIRFIISHDLFISTYTLHFYIRKVLPAKSLNSFAVYSLMCEVSRQGFDIGCRQYSSTPGFSTL